MKKPSAKSGGAEEKTSTYKVYIIDPYPILRLGLAQCIRGESHIDVCGESDNIEQALKDLPVCRPHLVIVDLEIGGNSGFRHIEDVRRYSPHTAILVFSAYDETPYAERCFKAGARGYVMKTESIDVVMLAVRKVLQGGMHVSDRLGNMFFDKLFLGQYHCSSRIESLSNRELEVFQLLGHGLRTRQIADQLNLSVKTIETYIDHIKKKMNLKDIRQVLKQSIQWITSENMRSQ